MRPSSARITFASCRVLMLLNVKSAVFVLFFVNACHFLQNFTFKAL